jgi:hypothetical protein
MDAVELRCKSCGAPLGADDCVRELRMARCSHCGAVSQLENLPPAGGGGGAAPPAEEVCARGEVPMPNGIEVLDIGEALQITRKWFGWHAIPLVIFCLFWNGFMIAWHTIAIREGQYIMNLFGLIHTAVGVGVGYYCLATFLNTTIIRVGAGMMQVMHQPLPWLGAKDLQAAEMDQIWSKEQVHRNKNGVNYSYQVHARMKDGRDETIVKGLPNADQAFFIEQKIETFLGIRDRAVRGEISR